MHGDRHVLRVTAHPQILVLELQAPRTITVLLWITHQYKRKKDRQYLVDTGGKGRQKLTKIYIYIHIYKRKVFMQQQSLVHNQGKACPIIHADTAPPLLS